MSNPDRNVDFDLANSYAWLADAYLKSGDIEKSLQNRKIQFDIESSLLLIDNRNIRYIDQITGTNISLFDLYMMIEKKQEALKHINMAKDNLELLYSIEKNNATYSQYRTKIAKRYKKLGRK
jgi:tetratricopeptide (TPR) repeat protein